MTSGKLIDTAFASVARRTPDALLVGTGLSTSRCVQLVQLATHYKFPVIDALREIAEIGGLMSYGASLREAYRRYGIYVGRILKGDIARLTRRSCSRLSSKPRQPRQSYAILGVSNDPCWVAMHELICEGPVPLTNN